jgi:hypothetical protein
LAAKQGRVAIGRVPGPDAELQASVSGLLAGANHPPPAEGEARNDEIRRLFPFPKEGWLAAGPNMTACSCGGDETMGLGKLRSYLTRQIYTSVECPMYGFARMAALH